MKSQALKERDYDKFVAEYLSSNCSAKDAAKKIGITEHTGGSWLKQDYVQSKINDFKKTLIKELVITKNDVLSELWAIARDQSVSEKYRIQAMQEINKMLAFLAPTQIDVNSTERKMTAVFVLPANTGQAEKWQGDIKHLVDLSKQKMLDSKTIDMQDI